LSLEIDGFRDVIIETGFFEKLPVAAAHDNQQDRFARRSRRERLVYPMSLPTRTLTVG
jgi:hypothetical protein